MPTIAWYVLMDRLNIVLQMKNAIQLNRSHMLNCMMDAEYRVFFSSKTFVPTKCIQDNTKLFKVSFYKVRIISFFVDCHDLMPKDCSFFANADAYGCETDFPKWFGMSGKIKDYCRASCRVCDSDGKYLIL